MKASCRAAHIPSSCQVLCTYKEIRCDYLMGWFILKSGEPPTDERLVCLTLLNLLDFLFQGHIWPGEILHHFQILLQRCSGKHYQHCCPGLGLLTIKVLQTNGKQVNAQQHHPASHVSLLMSWPYPSDQHMHKWGDFLQGVDLCYCSGIQTVLHSTR